VLRRAALGAAIKVGDVVVDEDWPPPAGSALELTPTELHCSPLVRQRAPPLAPAAVRSGLKPTPERVEVT
jgi:hypothetical protein